MDKLNHYRGIVKRVIDQYASYKPSHGKIDTEAIVDPIHDHYEVMHVGWDGERRVHGSVIHLDICNGKIWIQYDGTSLARRRGTHGGRSSQRRYRAGIPSRGIAYTYRIRY